MKVINLFVLILLVACGSRMEKPVATIDSRDYEYKECFNDSDSMRNTNVKGKGQVKIGFIVLPDGKVEDEKIIESSFKDPNFHACLLEVTRSMNFPAPKSGAATNTTKVINFSSKIKMNY